MKLVSSKNALYTLLPCVNASSKLLSANVALTTPCSTSTLDAEAGEPRIVSMARRMMPTLPLIEVE